MKSGKGHSVPLCSEAVDILKQVPRFAGSELVFNGARGGMLSENAFGSVIKRMNAEDAEKGGSGYVDVKQDDRVVSAHGFRSTFAEWARRQRDFPDELSELAHAHVNDDETRVAYKRDQLFDLRVKLMARWSEFLNTLPAKGDNVVKLEKAQA